MYRQLLQNIDCHPSTLVQKQMHMEIGCSQVKMRRKQPNRKRNFSVRLFVVTDLLTYVVVSTHSLLTHVSSFTKCLNLSEIIQFFVQIFIVVSYQSCYYDVELT